MSRLPKTVPMCANWLQLSHVSYGEEAGQAAHKALTRYSSWSSRLRNGCKQQQEQYRAAWAWQHEWRNLAQLSSSLPHWNSPFHLSSIHNSKDNTQTTLACLYMRTHACTHYTSTCFHALVRAAVLRAQAQGPNKLWHMHSCQL